jgi:uncharacterized membrane protein
MRTVANVLTGLVALEHVGIMVLEMFSGTTRWAGRSST